METTGTPLTATEIERKAMREEIFIWREGDSTLSPCEIFHGRKGWIQHGDMRIQMIFDERKGWISPMEFYAHEVLIGEHRHRGGE